MTTMELAEPRRTIGQLRHCVGSLRSGYGGTPAERRLQNDLERLEIDAAACTERPATTVTPRPRTGDHDVMVVPGTPYDPDLWRGGDDEGVGGYHRHES